MGWILEEEKKGLEGEPARARIFLKLAVLGWVLQFLLLKSGYIGLKMFGAIFLLGAIAATARGMFHLVTVGIVRLPRGTQGVVQVLVALIGAAVPFVYLFPHETAHNGQILVQAFDPFIRGLLVWLPMSLFVYIVYAAASSFPSLLAVRRYLILAAGAFLIAFIGGQGGFDTDEDGHSSSVESPDPKSIEGQMGMAASYIRLIILGYGTLLFSDFRQRALSRRQEKSLGKSHESQ